MFISAALLGLRILQVYLVYHLICNLIFGRNWAFLIPKSQRPAILNQKHGDFLFLKWLPRSLTAWTFTRAPIKLLGTCPRGVHYDIPPDGTWVLCFPFYFAFKTKGIRKIFGRPFNHGRFGERPDYIDKYSRPLAIALKIVS